ncbi:major facilitator superfamily transporter [Lecanosticta acicola]|uniref:Major facilitator superfamily transporter n=1 Tax=Lecanosticta acicola TaxID=111012 RepID=A0AAI9E7D5_9PEZI|nr:major facilitator superfamily transporter [Lecanosticta acicola]
MKDQDRDRDRDRDQGQDQDHERAHASGRPTSPLPDLDEKGAASSSPNAESSNASSIQEPSTTTTPPPLWRRIYSTLYWIPPNCRWDPSSPPVFSMAHNVMFAFAGAFTVANLYYNHPILNILAKDFGVSYVEVSQIPTLAQAGYATGLLFLCPLGDLLKRRPFVLSLVFFTATLCIGLCTTSSVKVFSAIQYITGVTTVTPQLMMPLVGDLAPPKKRAAALSIVTSGLMLGILLARLLSGIVTQYTSWRVIYWMSVGLQYLIFILLWLFMPDYPSTNPGGLNYFKMLWSIVVMFFKHPVLFQACWISYLASSTFTNYWTVLTFLLAGPPYYYTPVVIGLFALIGISAMCLGPIWAKYVTDRFVPLFTVFLGMIWIMLGVCIGSYTGTFTIAGPVIQALFQDFGLQTSQIANRSAIFTIEPKGRSRVNTAFMIFTFLGQLTGTSVGARLYEIGGWRVSGSYSVGAIGLALIVTLLRGPWEEGWIGWHGGYSILKKDRNSADGKGPETANPLRTTEQDTKDVEKNGHHDQHEHHHGHDDQEAVNRTDPEKGLELAAAEDTNDDIGSDKSEEGISPVPPPKEAN